MNKLSRFKRQARRCRHAALALIERPIDIVRAYNGAFDGAAAFADAKSSA